MPVRLRSIVLAVICIIHLLKPSIYFIYLPYGVEANNQNHHIQTTWCNWDKPSSSLLIFWQPINFIVFHCVTVSFSCKPITFSIFLFPQPSRWPFHSPFSCVCPPARQPLTPTPCVSEVKVRVARLRLIGQRYGRGKCEQMLRWLWLTDAVRVVCDRGTARVDALTTSQCSYAHVNTSIYVSAAPIRLPRTWQTSL